MCIRDRFHPVKCNEFIYSSSKGTIRLCDMRENALCDEHAKCKCLGMYAHCLGVKHMGKRGVRGRGNQTELEGEEKLCGKSRGVE